MSIHAVTNYAAVKRATLRILRGAAFVCVALLVTATVFVQIQQRLFRSRCERLLADMQSIRLHQTTWAEAQTLMRRWGKWGHYEGECNATNCKYKIKVENAMTQLMNPPNRGLLVHLLDNALTVGLYGLAGGRCASFGVGFIVQDGSIWRTETYYAIDVPPKHFLPEPEDQGSFLQLEARSRDSIRDFSWHKKESWTLGAGAAIDDHPYYTVGRPGGCESCILGEVTYAVQSPPEVVREVTSYNFGCLTRRTACQTLEDLLPSAKKWHLYDPPWGVPDERQKSDAVGTCKTPLWAIGRDAASVFVVDAGASQRHKEEYRDFEMTAVRLIEAMKQPAPWPSGTTLTLIPYEGERYVRPFQAPEHFEMGKRYLAIVSSSFDDPYGKSLPGGPPEPSLGLGRCGIFPDTPQNRAELQKGFALNDHLRVPEF